MADTIKIGSLDISAFKVGSSDCKIYLGNTLLYPQSPTPPTPTLKWVSYSEGDTIPSDLQIYGVKGIARDLGRVFYYSYEGIYFELDRRVYNLFIGGYPNECYSEYGIASNTSVEYIFSNVGCSDSYTVSSKTIGNISNDIQLYIYA